METNVQFYTRNGDGVCQYQNLDEAIAEFFSDNGYRLTIILEDDSEFVLRRGVAYDDSTTKYLDEKLGQQSTDCLVTFRTRLSGENGPGIKDEEYEV